MKVKVCKNCKFFQDKDIGHCRRWPPVRENNGNNAGFPLVDAKNWFCGEFKMRLRSLFKRYEPPREQVPPAQPHGHDHVH